MEQGSRFAAKGGQHGDMNGSAPGELRQKYGRFLGTLGVSLVVMYFLAFQQIEHPGHFHWSLSVFWISLSMVSAMGIIMLVSMRRMLPHRKANLALFALFAVALLGAFGAGRVEAGVGDDAFLRSMIPHHSRAIHMCEQAALADPEVIELCGEIIEAQREEIAQMERMIERRG